MPNDKQSDLPGVVINVEEAVIQTATIQIQMLTIDRRKVTMGLFRQFQKRDVLSRETGEIRGTPWGLINYFWPDCGGYSASGGAHLHVLWQDADKLYRDCIFPDGHKAQQWRSLARHLREQARLLVWSVIYADPDSLTMQPHDDSRYAVKRKTESRCWYIPKKARTVEYGNGGYELELWRNDFERRWVSENSYRYTLRPKEYVLKELMDRCWDKAEEVSDDPAERWAQSFEVSAEAQEWMKKAAAVEQRWDIEYRSLKALNQLFIAG